jgi:hypothetical protein
MMIRRSRVEGKGTECNLSPLPLPTLKFNHPALSKVIITIKTNILIIA